MEEREQWLRSARQRYRRLLMTVVLCCLLLLLSGFVAVARGELFRAPALLGPPGGQQLVAGYVGPLVTEPSFVLSWQEPDGSWAAAVEIPGRYESACLYQGLLYVFFDDRSYSCYRRGEHVARELFPFDWTPAAVVAFGKEMVAFGGVGEKAISVASLRGGEWREGPTLDTRGRPVGSMEAAALSDGIAVCWHEEGKEAGGPEQGIFLDSFDGQHWGEVRVASLGPVRGCALGKEPGGGVTIVSLEPDAQGGSEKLWERVGDGETWRAPQPVNLPHALLGGRVLDFSLAEGPGGPQLVVSRAGGIEAYERHGADWERGAVLLARGWPGGLGVRAWFAVSLGALAVLGMATVMLLARLGSASEGAVHSEIGYASLVERGVAVAFDMLLVGVGVLLLSDISDLREAAVAATLSQVVYGTVLEARWGQTIGKRLVGIVVVTPGLEAIGLRRSFVRNALRPVDGLAFYLVAVLSVVLTPQRQRLGDRAAGTVVLRESTLLVPRAATVAAKPDAGESEEGT